MAESHNTGDTAPYLQAEGERVGELMQEGILETILLKADQSGAFLVVEADSEAEARAALESLPLAKNNVTSIELKELITP